MKKSPFSSFAALSRELRRRKVYPVITAYAVLAWILLQIGEVTFDPLGAPDWLMKVIIVAVILGFPVAVILSWIFDITPTGLLRDSDRHINSDLGDDSPSIAVLPFTDMSADQDQGYFCEGVAEEILNALSKISQLHVAARMSSFQYKGGDGDVRHIGNDLGVKTILEGSVRKSGEQLRVTAQLISVADGFHLWSKTFDQELKDIFAIQDEIASSIAESLLDTLVQAKTTSSKDVLAYEYYLRGRQFFHRLRKKNLDFARQMFRQALDLDPDFALAWAGYADCYSFLIMYVDPKQSYREQASEASKRALELAPDLAEAHASRGLAHLSCEEFELAEKQFEQALKLNPKLYEAYYFYGRTRFHQGDMQMAIDLFAKAAAVNPDDYQSRLLRVRVLEGMGRMEEAIEEGKLGVAAIERHLEFNPDDSRALHLGAGSLILLGEIERAKDWLRRALEIDPTDSVVLYNMACNCATMGEADEALDYLEQAIDNGVVSLAWMKNDEDLKSLRGHPRYEKQLARLESKTANK